MIGIDAEDRRLLGLLISPSWLSGLIAIIVGLTVSVGVIVAFNANNSSVQQQLVAWQQNKPQQTLTRPGEAPPNNEKPSLKTTWPLLVVWAVVGLLVYALAATVVHSFSDAESLRESLGYVNAQPDKLIAITVEHIVLRGVAAILFGLLVAAFFKAVIPYSITAAHASASEILSLTGILYALISFAVVALCVHLQIVFLRLSLGRVRLFSSS